LTVVIIRATRVSATVNTKGLQETHLLQGAKHHRFHEFFSTQSSSRKIPACSSVGSPRKNELKSSQSQFPVGSVTHVIHMPSCYNINTNSTHAITPKCSGCELQLMGVKTFYLKHLKNRVPGAEPIKNIHYTLLQNNLSLQLWGKNRFTKFL